MTIKLDLPVPLSPATTIRTPVRPYGFAAPAEALAIERQRQRLCKKKPKTKNPKHEAGFECDGRSVNYVRYRGQKELRFSEEERGVVMRDVNGRKGK